MHQNFKYSTKSFNMKTKIQETTKDKVHSVEDNNRVKGLPMHQCSEKKFGANYFSIFNSGWRCKAKPLNDHSFLQTLQPALFCNIR